MAGQFAGIEMLGVDEVAEDHFRALIHGRQGTGKSTFASTIAEAGPTLYVDLVGEKGIRSFKGATYAKNIRVIRPKSITELDDIYWQLDEGDHPFKAVVVDSLTSVQKMAMRYLQGFDETAVREIRKGADPASQRTWGQALDIMVDMATFWYGLADADRESPMHVIMTAQTKFKEDQETGESVATPDVQKGALSATLATPDYIFYTDLEDNPDAVADEDLAPVNHIVRFGANPQYMTKGRVPVSLRGKFPPVFGRKTAPSLITLGRALQVGGIPAKKKARANAPAKDKD